MSTVFMALPLQATQEMERNVKTMLMAVYPFVSPFVHQVNRRDTGSCMEEQGPDTSP